MTVWPLYSICLLQIDEADGEGHLEVEAFPLHLSKAEHHIVASSVSSEATQRIKENLLNDGHEAAL